MTEEVPSTDQKLLSFCGMLHWFDSDLLLALAPEAAEIIGPLLSSDIVVALPDMAAFRIRDDIRVQMLTQLRTDHPQAELALRTRMFHYFLAQMTQVQDPLTGSRLAEDDCLAHLGELFLLIAARREWQTITRYVAMVRAVNPRQARHLQQLLFYDGFIAIRTQNYDGGQQLLQELLRQPDLSNDLRVQILNALGQAHWFQARYDQAIAAYLQVHEQASILKNLPYQGYALLNMGMVYSEIGRYERALDLSLQSLQVFRLLGDTTRQAQALHEIGNNAMQLGRWSDAQQHFQQAIQLYQAIGIMAQLANLYSCQGFLFHMLGEEASSESAYLQGLAEAQSADHGDVALTMDNLLHLGFLYQTQARWDAALAAYNQATSLAQRLRNHHVLALIQYRRGDVFKRQADYAAALQAYHEAITYIEDLRGMTENEEMKLGLLGSSQQIYESMILLCLECGRVIDAFDYVERARSRAFLDMLVKKAPELYAVVDLPTVKLSDIQQQLADDAVLIEYFTIGVLPQGEHVLNKLPKENTRLREHLTLTPQILLFAITRNHYEVHRVAFNPNLLRPSPSDPVPGRHLLQDRKLTHLYEQLFSPIEHLLPACKLLYIIPHGPLHYVPFVALRAPTNSYLLHATGPAIALAPSATILLRNCLGQASGRGRGMLALGYNGQGNNALQYAEIEADAIAALMGGVAWTGAAPKIEGLITDGTHARWLHIAGHAIYNALDPLDSKLYIAADEALSARTIIARLNLHADLVILSACTSGLSQVAPGDELFGLQRAFLYAGAATVICTLWEATDIVTLLVMEHFYQAQLQGQPPAAALRDTLVAVRAMTGFELAITFRRWRDMYAAYAAPLENLANTAMQQGDAQPYADPRYWAPFMLIGRPT